MCVHWRVLVKLCFLNKPLFRLFESELYAKKKIDKEKMVSGQLPPSKFAPPPPEDNCP